MSSTPKQTLVVQQPIRRLQEQYTKNGLRYRLAKRTDQVAMYHVLATYSDRVNHIEVFRIEIKPPDKPEKRIKCNKVDYEYFPSNSHFGMRYDSKAFCGLNKSEKAERYYQFLIKKSKGQIALPKVMDLKTFFKFYRSGHVA